MAQPCSVCPQGDRQGRCAPNAYLEPLTGSEDFAFMLEEHPGNIMLIGNGDTAGDHDTRYDFKYDAIPFGIAYFVSLVERSLPL